MRYAIVKKKHDWNLVPETKNKPNAQGTLFRAPVTARTPESRQPRGYSQERYSEIQAHLNGRVFGTKSGKRSTEFVEPGGVDRLTRTLARSTVPASRIRSVGLWVLDDKLDPGIVAAHKPNPGGKSTTIRIQPGQEHRSKSIIHEVGHEEHYRANDNKRFFGTEAGKGREEGYADRYASRHAFLPGYKKETDPGLYASGHRFKALRSPQSDFGQGYLAARYPVRRSPEPAKPQHVQETFF